MQRLKKLGLTVGTILGIVLVICFAAMLRGKQILTETFAVTNPELILPEFREVLMTEGERIFVTRGCVLCHGESGRGKIIIDAPLLGVIVAPNLTSGAKAATTITKLN